MPEPDHVDKILLLKRLEKLTAVSTERDIGKFESDRSDPFTGFTITPLGYWDQVSLATDYYPARPVNLADYCQNDLLRLSDGNNANLQSLSTLSLHYSVTPSRKPSKLSGSQTALSEGTQQERYRMLLSRFLEIGRLKMKPKTQIGGWKATGYAFVQVLDPGKCGEFWVIAEPLAEYDSDDSGEYSRTNYPHTISISAFRRELHRGVA